MAEPVHTLGTLRDDPIDGIANFGGKPHHFQRELDYEKNEWTDVCRLTPVSESTFLLAVEMWQINLRWEAAYVAGEAYLEDDPALPEEQERYNQLAALVWRAVKNAESESFEARAVFVRCPDDSLAVTWAKVNS